MPSPAASETPIGSRWERLIAIAINPSTGMMGSSQDMRAR
jgi:hypothetical protein